MVELVTVATMVPAGTPSATTSRPTSAEVKAMVDDVTVVVPLSTAFATVRASEVDKAAALHVNTGSSHTPAAFVER